jgi:catalase
VQWLLKKNMAISSQKNKQKGLKKPGTTNKSATENKKIKELSYNKEFGEGEVLTTDHGVKINDDQNSLKAGERGSTLLEDFILREKITHFDHERIPERIVHARGSGAHGIFELYKPIGELTKANFLNDTSKKTPVFVRFSTVAGSRGSSDMARDVRGFAVKFYTDEGNFDIVGNNMPVFFIQDSIKFPDLIHAVKPEPNNEIPQAASAHDTFWDFISLMPESAHMIMWVMSDRAIPRSLRMMEGFGVHTFRLINEKGKANFVKFHWKPVLGVHSVAWDEAQNISGKDPDFHRRDLWESIENGDYPEWELGIQIVPEKDEHKYEFDLLDPTKLIPEELVPVTIIGKMTLNRNPDNFFAETEQIAFHVGNIIPGIDFTNDPLMQGRLFSYTDTQLSRLGGPNFHEIPINRPVVPVHNNQRDGHMRQQINVGQASYHPNSTGGGCPFQAKAIDGGFTSFTEKIDAQKIRGRSKSFFDHFSQATLFFNSQSEAGKNHIINALRFELSKVETPAIRERMVGILTQIDLSLANKVAEPLGINVPKLPGQPINHSIPADGNPKDYQPVKMKSSLNESPSLNMDNLKKDSITTRKVAILAANGVNEKTLNAVKSQLKSQGARGEIISPKLGIITGQNKSTITVDKTLFNTASVLFDAVYVPGGEESIKALSADGDAVHFLNEAFKHCKPIGLDNEALPVFERTYFSNRIISDKKNSSEKTGIVINNNTKIFLKSFINAIKQGRFWDREKIQKTPA